jgi:hypothetical protein
MKGLNEKGERLFGSALQKIAAEIISSKIAEFAGLRKDAGIWPSKSRAP